ncbi:uncharacterized protein LOC119678541 isoform X2 [Teleopsis dalmanni]|nr:uncharacterized protein LOC119678541 isoform X2 [Teleopsis dalmanni]
MNNKKEMLEFRIRSDGSCCLNISDGKIMTDASRIVGGNFGSIEAGAVETVSLIWPTVSLYNRVGFCPIIIVSINANDEQKKFKHMLHFDTRFATLDPEGRTLRRHKNYKDCKNWDKEYLKNCTPVNCEERYFGRRNYYNHTSEQCEEVPRCAEHIEIYDIYGNECINPKQFCNENDLDMIRKGKYQEESLDPSSRSHSGHPHVVVNLPDDNKPTPNKVKKSDVKTIPSSRHQRENAQSVATEPTTANNTNDAQMPYWFKGVFDGLLIVGIIIFFQVFATIVIYILICFVIYLIVSWISKRNLKNRSVAFVIESPHSSTVCTTSSLMSQR